MVLEGVCEGVVAYMEGGREGGREEVVGRMVGMVGEHLAGVLQEEQREGGREGGRPRWKLVEEDVERLTVIVKGSEPRWQGGREGGREGGGEGAEIVQRLLPVFEALYQAYKGKAEVMEKVRRAPSLSSSLPP